MTRPGSTPVTRVSKHRVLLFPNSSKGVSHVLKLLARLLVDVSTGFTVSGPPPPFFYEQHLKATLCSFPRGSESNKTRLNRGVKQLFLPFKQHSQNKQGEGERHGAVEVSQTGVFHARWRTLQVCPRNILWKPKSLTPKPV